MSQFQLPDLPYDYDALEPHIDEMTMRIHHTRHHQAYVDNLNAALDSYEDLRKQEVEDLLRRIDTVPEEIRERVRNHGGGHANHSLFWQILSPDGGGQPDGELANRIESSFGDDGAFRQEFERVAKAHFGSGWTWLVVTRDGELKIVATPNQDSPLMHKQTPLMGIDVWEHAYYLKYRNRRAEYIDAWWNVIDWTQVAQNLEVVTSAEVSA